MITFRVVHWKPAQDKTAEAILKSILKRFKMI